MAGEFLSDLTPELTPSCEPDFSDVVGFARQLLAQDLRAALFEEKKAEAEALGYPTAHFISDIHRNDVEIPLATAARALQLNQDVFLDSLEVAANAQGENFGTVECEGCQVMVYQHYAERPEQTVVVTFADGRILRLSIHSEFFATLYDPTTERVAWRIRRFSPVKNYYNDPYEWEC